MLRHLGYQKERSAHTRIGPRHRNTIILLKFIDDLLCMSKTFEQHPMHLRQLFDKLGERNLTLNFEKSYFVCQEGRFLGHILSKDGLRPQPEELKIIKEFKYQEHHAH